MLRIPGMPLLPGTTFRDLSKTNFARKQNFMNCKGIGMLVDNAIPKLVNLTGTPSDLNCPPTEQSSLYPPTPGPKLPAWIAYDKMCLCFNAYFKETLQEVYHAPYQVRKVKIYYYLEDGTMSISEPKVENSGLTQGCVVSRQRVPKPAPCQHEFMTMLDLNVNTTVKIFDRVYHITSCDKFTRHFLNKSGIPVPDPIEEPVDPMTEMRRRQKLKPTGIPPKKHAFAQFLAFDRQILKFYGYWDDRTEFGDVRKLEICYYLADDTIDIKEVFPRNSGREGPALFLKRGRLPREFMGLPLPGQQTNLTVLNVLGSNMRDMRYVVDPLNAGEKRVLYYGENDLQIGAVLNVYGRSVVLTDCDEFTKNYYRKKYGVEDFTPAPLPGRAEDSEAEQKERVLPPYNGWGSYEDSEGNCKSVEPKPPQGDFKKFIRFDRFVLRYGAKMLSTIRDNCERLFVISYYLADDTIQIFEIAERNSGFLGGEFLKRVRIPIPGQKKFTSKRPQYYQPQNLYIGSTVMMNDFLFHITSADEYTLLFMEHHADEFPHANVDLIMKKVRKALTKDNLKEFVCKCVPEGTEFAEDIRYINYESLKKALISLLGDEISNHEIVTLCRFYSAEQAPPMTCHRDTVRAAAHLEIKRNLWNAMDELKEHLFHINPLNKSFISVNKVKSSLKGCRLPFNDDLIEDIVMVLNTNECGEIEVCDLLNFLDMNCGVIPDIAPVNINFELCPKIPFLHKGRLVNFKCFLKHLNLDTELNTNPTTTTTTANNNNNGNNNSNNNAQHEANEKETQPPAE